MKRFTIFNLMLLTAVLTGCLQGFKNQAKFAERTRGSVLIAEARDGTLDQIKHLIGSGVNCQDGNGDTALMAAATKNRVDIVKYLLEEGADASIMNHLGQTALDQAKQTGAKDAINVLTDPVEN